MKHNFFIIVLLFSITICNSQELNSKVSIDYSKISTTNPQIYKTLEKSLTDFVNKTVWTDKNYKPNEKINCSFFITINGADSNNFDATIQVQASRPVYNSTFSTSILNINDKDFNFQYTEFENFVYNPNSFDSNLVAVFVFYSQLIIGLDAETFMPDSGQTSLEAAQNISNLGNASSIKGWNQTSTTPNRFTLISDLMSSSFKGYKEAMYGYHFKGLDQMAKDLKTAKQEIKKAVETMVSVYNVRPSGYLLRIFIDAKSDEIVSIFSGGPSVEIDDLVANLNKISPVNYAKWSQIKL